MPATLLGRMPTELADAMGNQVSSRGGSVLVLRRLIAWLGCIFGLTVPFLAMAQVDAGNVPARLRTSAGVDVSLGVSDNLDPEGAVATSGAIVDIAPYLSVAYQGGVARAKISARVTRHEIASDRDLATTDRSLDALGAVDLAGKALSLEARAVISSGTASALGNLSIDTGLPNSNRVETTTLQVSPRSAGMLGTWADYSTSFVLSRSRSDGGSIATAGPQLQQSLNVTLSGNRSGRVNWTFGAVASRSDPAVGETRSTHQTRLAGVVPFGPQLRMSVGVTNDSGNLTTRGTKSSSGALIGAEWAPTERTKVRFESSKRVFGRGHTFEFAHRTPMSSWSYVDAVDVVLPADVALQQAVLPAAQAIDAQFQGTQTDAQDRAVSVDDQLSRLGLAGVGSPQAGVLTSRPHVQRRKVASMALTGARNTLAASVQRVVSVTNSIDGIQDDLDVYGDVTQRLWTLAYSHRISQSGSVSVTSSKSTGSGQSVTSDTKLTALSVTHALGPRSNVSLLLRSLEATTVRTGTFNEQRIMGMFHAEF